LLCSEVTEFKGSVGDFNVRIADENGAARDLKVGTAIIAEETVELKPKGLYGYGELEGVYTVSELLDVIQIGGVKDGEAVAFILCAGAREELGRTYSASSS
jgi:heterodisulfide reductase subunit A-like polyferredoxin